MNCTCKECFSKAEKAFSVEKITKELTAQTMKEWRSYEYAVEQTLKNLDRSEEA